MAITLEGNGTITGVTTLTTPLDDIQFDSIKITGIATAGTFQAGTGVSMASPRSQTLSFYTNNTEWLSIDDSGRVGIGTTNAAIAADTNNAKVVNAGIITANQYYGNQLTAVGSRVTGVGTFENGLNITGNISNGLNVSAGIATFAGALDVNSTTNFADDVTFTSASGNNILFDKSDNSLQFGDSVKAIFGTDDDAEIYHNGSHQYNKCSTGYYHIEASRVRVNNAAGTETCIETIENGAVNLYFDDSVRFATSKDGVDITGNVSIGDTIVHTGDTDTTIRFPAADTISFETAGSERARIDSSGRLLIGTTTEGQTSADNLTIADSASAGITLRSGTSNSGHLFFSDATSGVSEYDGYVLFNHDEQYLSFGTVAIERMRIASNGRVGIGTDLGATYDSTYNHLVLHNGNSNVGMLFDTDSSSGGYIGFKDTRDGTVQGLISYTHNDDKFDFRTAGASRFTIGSDGAAKFNPNAGGTLTITGSAAHTSKVVIGDNANTGGGNCLVEGGDGTDWFTIQSNGNVKFTSGRGITFDDSSTSAVLDDYEEGTFTPGLICSGGTGTAGNTNAGFYTKIGRLVTCHGTLHWTALSGSTQSNAAITGLPYTTLNATSYRSGAVLGGQVIGIYWSGLDHAYINFGCDANMDQFYITAVNMADHSGSNYTHQPNVAATGTLYGFTLTYYTA